jgi:hypothetical protein
MQCNISNLGEANNIILAAAHDPAPMTLVMILHSLNISLYKGVIISP